jgi:hypothetical protein
MGSSVKVSGGTRILSLVLTKALLAMLFRWLDRDCFRVLCRKIKVFLTQKQTGVKRLLLKIVFTSSVSHSAHRPLDENIKVHFAPLVIPTK